MNRPPVQTNRLQEAKQAFLTHDHKRSMRAHSHHAIKAPESHQGGMDFVKSAVYGGVDGIITTASLIFSAVGNHVDPKIIIILVFSNAVADGLSMALSDYISSKSEMEYIQAERAREEWEVENYPEGERQEMFQIYKEKGLTSEDANVMVDCLSRNKEAFIDIMMIEELGLIQTEESPVKSGIVTFLSFIFFGMTPVVPRLVSSAFKPVSLLPSAIIATAIVLFLLGSLKTKITGKNWIISGFETLLLGATATAFAFLISYFFGDT